jgi:lysophospholipase L1-like esterase
VAGERCCGARATVSSLFTFVANGIDFIFSFDCQSLETLIAFLVRCDTIMSYPMHCYEWRPPCKNAEGERLLNFVSIPKLRKLCVVVAGLCILTTSHLLMAQSPTLPKSATMPTAHSASAAIPVPRSDTNSKLAHQQLLAKAKAGGIDLYFLGDSIIRRWGYSDRQWSKMLANWKQNFYGWNAGDFGWGADRLENILWRVRNGELDGLNPKVIVILAGTNNVGNHPGGDEKVADILKGFDALIATCHEKAPSAKIILTAIFPRNDNPAVLPEIRRINDGLAKVADGKAIFYININDKLADATGKLFDGMTVDGLHPTVKGYQIWADALRPILTQILGPPAQTDHAPLPTGDPSTVHPKAGS